MLVFAWIHVCIESPVPRSLLSLCIWSLLNMESSVHEVLSIWSPLYLGPSLSGFLCTWNPLNLEFSVHGVLCI